VYPDQAVRRDAGLAGTALRCTLEADDHQTNIEFYDILLRKSLIYQYGNETLYCTVSLIHV
jgi:hypothetical protein